MRCVVQLTPNAVNDLFAIVDYIAEDNEERAFAFVDHLRDRIERTLSTFPESGSRWGAYRYTVFSGYVVVYSVDQAADRVNVVLVSEGHRDWQRLLEGRD
jgi:addiction module RelE/StbE family toxin